MPGLKLRSKAKGACASSPNEPTQDGWCDYNKFEIHQVFSLDGLFKFIRLVRKNGEKVLMSLQFRKRLRALGIKPTQI